jgi:hypothetical protein
MKRWGLNEVISKTKSENGAALLSVLLISVIIMALSAAMINLNFQSVAPFQSDFNYIQSLYNDRLGMKDLYNQINLASFGDVFTKSSLSVSLSEPSSSFAFTLNSVTVTPSNNYITTSLSENGSNGYVVTVDNTGIGLTKKTDIKNYNNFITNNSIAIVFNFTFMSGGVPLTVPMSYPMSPNGSGSGSGNGNNTFAMSFPDYSGSSINMTVNGQTMAVGGSSSNTFTVQNGSFSSLPPTTWNQVTSSTSSNKESNDQLTGSNITLSGNDNKGSVWVSGTNDTVSSNINNGLLVDTGDNMTMNGNLNNGQAVLIAANSATISGNLNSGIVIGMGNDESISGNMNSSDIVLLGNNDNISGNVTNIFYSGSNLDLSGNVNGCFDGAGGTVVISGNTNNVYFTGSNLTINGNVNGTIYTSGNVTVTGNTNSIVKVTGTSVKVDGNVNGSVTSVASLPAESSVLSCLSATSSSSGNTGGSGSSTGAITSYIQ